MHLSPDERAHRTESFAQGYARFRAALEAIPREAWLFRPGAGRWSIHQVVVHVADTETHAYIRARRILAEPGKDVIAFDQDLWADRLGYEEDDLEGALELTRLLRATTHRLLLRLPPSAWSLSVEHPQAGTVTLDRWLVTYDDHMDIHIRQMQRNYAQWQEQQDATP